MLINPGKRRTKRRAAGRTAAQKRATAKLVAMNRAKRKPRTNPRRKGVVRTASYASNPGHRSRRVTRRVSRRSYRRNPAGRRGNLMGLLLSSFQGAAGAMVVNTAFNYLPLPAMLTAGPMKHVAKGALAVGLGMLVKNRMVAEMVKGSLTVTMHDALKENLASLIPGANLGYYAGGAQAGFTPRFNAQPAPALSEYVNSPGMSGMGSMSDMSEYASMY